LTIEAVVSWQFAPTFDAAHRAALEAGKPLVYVCPPAGWALVPLATRLAPTDAAGPQVVVLAPEPADVGDVAGALDTLDALRPVHGLTGLARTARLLSAGALRTLVLTPPDALALARQSAVPLTRVRALVIAWPEAMRALGQGEALDAILAETPDAQRLVVTTDERNPDLADLLVRVAHRAPVVVAARLPEPPPTLPLRWIGTDDDRRSQVVRAALDVLVPARAVVWEPLAARAGRWNAIARDPAVRLLHDIPEESVDLVVAGDLPSAEGLAALSAAARDVVVLARASQVTYLERLSASARALRVAAEADAALDRAAGVRRRLRERLADGNLGEELLTLGALFDEYDPTLVAAAALALAAAPAATTPASESAGWTRLFVTAGRRDGVRPGDLVGALVNEVGLPRNAIGRIDLRDGFALVEIRADEAARAQRGLTGTNLRGKRVTARPERR
jgi:ATP-dependent RNA helicase DeaD